MEFFDPPAYEPTSAVGLLPWLLYLIPFLLIGGIVAYGHWKSRGFRREQREKTDAIVETVGKVRDNVQNGHPTPMREDIDKLLRGMSRLEEAVLRIDGRIITLGDDLSTERSERIAADNRIAGKRRK